MVWISIFVPRCPSLLLDHVLDRVYSRHWPVMVTWRAPRLPQTTTINKNQSLISINKINKNPLINIDWLSQSIKIDNHSPMRLNVIDFHWLLLIINSWLCNSLLRINKIVITKPRIKPGHVSKHFYPWMSLWCEKSREKRSKKKVWEKSREKCRGKSWEKNREKNLIKARKKSRKMSGKNFKSSKNSGKKLKDEKKVEWGKQNLHGTHWAPRKRVFTFSLSFFLFLPWGFCFPRWVFYFTVSSCLFFLLLLPWDILFLLWHFGSLTPDLNDNFYESWQNNSSTDWPIICAFCGW